MTPREKEYKEIFIAEALEVYDSLSRNIILLEANPKDDKVLGELFRMLHNLKANSRAVGYEEIANIAHKLENIFSAIRERKIEFKGDTVTVLFDGIDMIGVMIANIGNPTFAGAEP